VRLRCRDRAVGADFLVVHGGIIGYPMAPSS
jgi:hypothetical protein